MEAPDQYTQSVHVLRHTFRPSEPLFNHLAAFTTPESRASAPRFLLSSTREYFLDSIGADTPKARAEIFAMRQEFLAEDRAMRLKEARYRFIANKGLQLAFAPQLENRFTRMTELPHSLRMIRVGRRALGAFMVVNIPERNLVRDGGIAKAWTQLRDAINDPVENAYNTVQPENLAEQEDLVMFKDSHDMALPSTVLRRLQMNAIIDAELR